MIIKDYWFNGRKVNNHQVIEVGKVTYFKSYNSIIVKIEKGIVTLGRDWNHSKTTSKWRARFLGESTATTKTKIKSGEYKIDESL